MDEVLCYVVTCQGACGASFSDTSDTCPSCEGGADLVLEVTGNALNVMNYESVNKVRNMCCTIHEIYTL